MILIRYWKEFHLFQLISIYNNIIYLCFVFYWIYSDRAYCYYKLGKYSESLADIDRYDKLKKDHKLSELKGKIYKNMNLYPEAVLAFTEYILLVYLLFIYI